MAGVSRVGIGGRMIWGEGFVDDTNDIDGWYIGG